MVTRIKDNVLYVNGVPTDIVAQFSGGPARMNVGVLSANQATLNTVGVIVVDNVGNARKPDGTVFSGGAPLSNTTPQPLGTASAGTTGLASDAGHIHARPTAAELNALGIPIAWNASNNSPTLTSGQASIADNAFRVTVAGNTALDGIVSWAVDDIAYFDGTAWQKIAANIGNISHVYDYTASATNTGATTESAALKSLVIGVLPIGTVVTFNIGLTGNNDSGTTTLRVKLGTTQMIALTNGTAQLTNAITGKIVITAAGAEWASGHMYSSSGIQSGNHLKGALDTTTSSQTFNVTLQNTTTTRQSAVDFVDISVALP